MKNIKGIVAIATLIGVGLVTYKIKNKDLTKDAMFLNEYISSNCSLSVIEEDGNIIANLHLAGFDLKFTCKSIKDNTATFIDEKGNRELKLRFIKDGLYMATTINKGLGTKFLEKILFEVV